MLYILRPLLLCLLYVVVYVCVNVCIYTVYVCMYANGVVVSEPEFRFRELRNFHTRNLSELIRFGRCSVRVDGILGLEPESPSIVRIHAFPAGIRRSIVRIHAFPAAIRRSIVRIHTFTRENYPPKLTDTASLGVQFFQRYLRGKGPPTDYLFFHLTCFYIEKTNRGRSRPTPPVVALIS